MRNFGLFSILCVFLLFSSVLPYNTVVGYKPNQINVKFTPRSLSEIKMDLLGQGRTGLAKVDSLNWRYGAFKIQRLFPYFKIKFHNGKPNTLDAWYTIYFSEDINETALAAKYASLSEILYSEASPICKIYAAPNDPQYPNQWHLNQANDADIDAPEAWNLWSGNPSIIVAIMDTGVKWWHTDLAGALADENNRNSIKGNMWINTAELNGSAGVDDDGNGKIDDWVGWDFVTGNPEISDVGDDYDIEDNDPRDHNGHGTHCAGNIAAINNNGAYVCSSAGGWGEDAAGNGNGVKIMALRIGWDDIFGLGYVGMDFAANAFIYAADNGAKIASCSWGSSENASLTDATNYFLYNTTSPTGNDPLLRLIFKAAGNDGNDLGSSSGDYLIDRSEVITVAATDENDARASFSNYGAVVDISAPGNNIVSTSINSNGYETESGTSMSTPITASTAALVWSYNNALSAIQVKTILFDSADPLSASGMGAGRINDYNCLTDPDISLPVELRGFEASADNHTIRLHWQTQSEVQNLGFNILRRTQSEADFKMIGSYKTNPALQGLGNSSFGKDYFYEDSDVGKEQTYYYILEDVDFSGRIRQHGPVSGKLESSLVPEKFALLTNYPNPFNSSTRIEIYINSKTAESYPVSLVIFNGQGRKIITLFHGTLKAGNYFYNWNGKNGQGLDVSSGIYYGVLSASRFRAYKKLIVLR